MGDRAYRAHRHIYPPKDRMRILVFPMDSEADAFESERALISLFGRVPNGLLRNLTDGGEGPAGLIHRADSIQRMRTNRRGKALGNKNAAGTTQSQESNLSRSEKLKGRVIFAETREKIRKARLGVPRPDISAANYRRWSHGA